MKTFKEFLQEAKDVEVDVDWDFSGDVRKEEAKHGVTIKAQRNGTALISGDKSKVFKYLSDVMTMDKRDIKDLYPELD